MCDARVAAGDKKFAEEIDITKGEEGKHKEKRRRKNWHQWT